MKAIRHSIAAPRFGKFMMVSLVTVGLLLSAGGLAQADRGSDRGRSESRYEARYEERTRIRHNERSGQYRVKQKTTLVRELPRGHRQVVVANTPYYVHNHRYYTRAPGGYFLVAPPVGAIVANLPRSSVNVSIGGVWYARHDNVYYRQAARGYQVVAPPYYAPSAVATPLVEVWAATLNVRSGPGLNFAVVSQTRQGQRLVVTGQAPGWYLVRLPNGLSGWVMSDYTHRLHAG